MAPRTLRLPAQAVGWLSALAGGLACAADEDLPQVLPPRVQERVTDRVVAPAIVRHEQDAGKVPSQKLTAGVDVGMGYDDNIYLTAKDPKGDAVIRITPKIAYVKGNPSPDAEDSAYVRIAYKPSAIFFMKNTNSDRTEHQAGVDAGWHRQGVTIDYSGGLQRLSDPTADTGGGETKRLEMQNTVKVTWTPREKITWQVAGGQSSVNYDSPRFFDAREYYGEGAMLFNYSPKTQLGIGYRAGTFEVDGAGRQFYQQFTGRARWQPREKIRLELQAGLEHRTFDAGSSNTPVVESRVTWMPRRNTDIYLSAYRWENASAYLAGENYTTTGGTLGVAQKIGDKWTARLEGGVERAAYTRVSGAGDSGREDRIYFLKPSVEYQFNDQVRAGLFYRYNKNQSNQNGFGFSDNSAGVELGYEF